MSVRPQKVESLFFLCFSFFTTTVFTLLTTCSTTISNCLLLIESKPLPLCFIDRLLPPVPVCGHHCSIWGGCDRPAARHWPNVAPLQQPLHAHEWRTGATQGITINALGFVMLFLIYVMFKLFHFAPLYTQLRCPFLWKYLNNLGFMIMLMKIPP